MDLNDALMLWPAMGYSTVTHDDGREYKILFLKDEEVVGHFTTVPGSMFWDYPQELVDKANALRKQGVDIYTFCKDVQFVKDFERFGY